MRRLSILMVASTFAMACADMPSAPLLEPQTAGFARSAPDYPPPPFQLLEGSATTEYGTFSFTAKFFANKPGNMAWLQFESTTTPDVSFSANARIMSVDDNVSGVGTISIGENTIQLSEIDTFTYQTYRTTGAISFSGGSILEGFAFTPRGGGGDEVCTIKTECYR